MTPAHRTAEPPSYALTVETPLGFEEAAAATRGLLAAQGFGVLTEVDLRATMREKLGAEAADEVGDYLILGACNPPLAHRAVRAQPEVGLLLPCNVVVRRDAGSDRTTVQAVDPRMMSALADEPEIHAVADRALELLRAALAGLPTTEPQADGARRPAGAGANASPAA